MSQSNTPTSIGLPHIQKPETTNSSLQRLRTQGMAHNILTRVGAIHEKVLSLRTKEDLFLFLTVDLLSLMWCPYTISLSEKSSIAWFLQKQFPWNSIPHISFYSSEYIPPNPHMKYGKRSSEVYPIQELWDTLGYIEIFHWNLLQENDIQRIIQDILLVFAVIERKFLEESNKFLAELALAATDRIDSLIQHLIRAEKDLERAEKVAQLDSLTWAFNRLWFISQVRKLAQASQKGTFLMLDIDHFKKINDTYGHDSGDRVLRELVRAIEYFLKEKWFWENSVLFRFGWEEFGIYFSSVNWQDGMQFAEDLRGAIENSTEIRESIKKEDNPLFWGITISIWLLEASMPSEKVINNNDSWKNFLFTDALPKADTALYHAKRNWRNRVEKFLFQIERSQTTVIGLREPKNLSKIDASKERRWRRWQNR
jgi:diguanylate cyclase (GGDEF)-like protein